jgi:hypothetical protein
MTSPSDGHTYLQFNPEAGTRTLVVIVTPRPRPTPPDQYIGLVGSTWMA